MMSIKKKSIVSTRTTREQTGEASTAGVARTSGGLLKVKAAEGLRLMAGKKLAVTRLATTKQATTKLATTKLMTTRSARE